MSRLLLFTCRQLLLNRIGFLLNVDRLLLKLGTWLLEIRRALFIEASLMLNMVKLWLCVDRLLKMSLFIMRRLLLSFGNVLVTFG